MIYSGVSRRTKSAQLRGNLIASWRQESVGQDWAVLLCRKQFLKLWVYWELGIIPVYSKTNTATKGKHLTWQRKSQFAPQKGHQVQTINSQLTPGAHQAHKHQQGCPQHPPVPSGSLLLPAVPCSCPETLPLQPAGASAWRTSTWREAGSQDIHLEDTWRRADFPKKNDAYLDSH